MEGIHSSWSRLDFFGIVWRQDWTAESTQEVDRILRDDQTSKQVCIPCNHLLFCVSTFSLFKSYTWRVLHVPVIFTMFLEILHHFFLIMWFIFALNFAHAIFQWKGIGSPFLKSAPSIWALPQNQDNTHLNMEKRAPTRQYQNAGATFQKDASRIC